jgi:hypothetical protein
MQTTTNRVAFFSILVLWLRPTRHSYFSSYLFKQAEDLHKVSFKANSAENDTDASLQDKLHTQTSLGLKYMYSKVNIFHTKENVEVDSLVVYVVIFFIESTRKGTFQSYCVGLRIKCHCEVLLTLQA